MVDHTVAEALVELRRVFKEDLSTPFPYDDCRRVYARAGKIADGLIPDLDLYFGDVAGYCSWGKRLQRLSQAELLAARATLARSFFEKHPEYLPLAVLINETDTPVLFADLKLHDELRGRLLAIIATLLAAAEPPETVGTVAVPEVAPVYLTAQSSSPQTELPNKR